MPRTAAKVTQADIARTMRAAVRAGVNVGRVEIHPDGSVVIHMVDRDSARPILPASEGEGSNEWDEVLPGGQR